MLLGYLLTSLYVRILNGEVRTMHVGKANMEYTDRQADADQDGQETI